MSYITAINSGTGVGQLFVSDVPNFSIRAIAPNYAVTTITNSDGGGGGDPYVTTMSGLTYKLPTLDAPIRYFQKMEGDKLLTINVSLKTIGSEELASDTLVSLLRLKNTMSAKQFQALCTKTAVPETLGFFDLVHIQYGEDRLVMRLWNSKFELVERVGEFRGENVTAGDHLEKSTGGLYKDYQSKTIRMTFGATQVYLSIYNSPMVRNGLRIETRGGRNASNGVIAHALTEKDMVLPSLDSIVAVPMRDATRSVVKQETFADKDGVRTRSIVSFK